MYILYVYYKGRGYCLGQFLPPNPYLYLHSVGMFFFYTTIYLQSCTFSEFQADNNHIIELNIEHLKLPCSQWLKIRTGDSILSHLTAHLAQSSNFSYPLYSTGPLFFLEFFSDVPVTALQECNGGFLIHAKQIGKLLSTAFSGSSSSSSYSLWHGEFNLNPLQFTEQGRVSYYGEMR